MILTGKSLQDFCKYIGQPFVGLNFDDIPDLVKQSYYIEFFCHVGIWESVFYKSYRSTGFKFYKVAVNQAIHKANEIYNKKHE